jgi:hypothetical protein
MTVMVLFWGVIIGLGAAVLSNLVYLVFVFPVAMGFASSNMIAHAIQMAKIRSALQLVFLCLLSAVAVCGTFHYSRYIAFQLRGAWEIFGDLDQATDPENLQVTQAFLDYALEEETGHTGFFGYMLYRAKDGMSIGRFLDSGLTWLYWLAEFGVILWIPLSQGRKLIQTAFCEACGNRIESEKHLGGTATANEPRVLELIRQKDFAELGRLLRQNDEVPSLELYYQGCQVCGQSRSRLVMRHAFQGAKGVLQFREAGQTLLQPQESALLLSQLSTAGD